MIDPSQVESAILNLCLNARDAMPDGGQLTITTSNEILEAGPSADDPAAGAYVRVMITDNGHGMAPDVKRQAFDPFFTTKGPSGSGLGLSQVYGMARQSGGTVRLESTEGQGTSVALLLPRATSDEETETPVRQQANESLEMTSLLVMVVDDDAAVRLVAGEMLRDLGCAVVQAAGGAEALDLVQTLTRQPDFFLLDYAMPGMTGLHLATTLREQGVTAAIALVTGYAELAHSDTDTSPLDGLLRKPFSIRELRTLIATLHKTRAEAEVPVLAK
jgi:CheY-like chemotaxis protein